MTAVVEQTRPPRRPALGAVGVVKAYVALTKPRVIELLLVVTVPTMMLAAGGLPSAWRVVAVLLGGTAAAGSANALNCYLDRDIDQVMGRTRQRPIVRHTVSPRSALVFGLVLGVFATAWMWLATNPLACALTVAAILFYIFVYTLGLKRRTSQNIVWGGAAGCMPVLIGWAAVTGRVGWPAVLLFGVIFFWTPIHYWPLAMKFRADYARAGVPMLPVVRPPVAVVRQILWYGWATVAVSLALWPVATGWVYGIAAAVLGVLFLTEAHRLYAQVRRDVPARPMRLFHLSNSYLALLFLALAIDTLL